MNRILSSAAIGMAVALFASVSASAAPMAGAVFTTDSTCSGVDLNIYDSKDAVYLDGGPHKGSVAGLPDGQYAVQVTEPDGTLLGSSVGMANMFPVTVVNGNFDSCYQLSSIVAKASDLSPGYDTTTNPGGEYKVWVSQDPAFANNATKTDNFKVEEVPCVDCPCPTCDQSVMLVDKFYDANANGAYDPGELLLAGWKIGIVPSVNPISWTPVTAVVDPGEYHVWEYAAVETSWKSTTPSDLTVTVAANEIVTVSFGNVCIGAGGGLTLGFWSNKNGQGLITGDDLCALNGLSLRTAAGGNFDPGLNCPSPSAKDVSTGKASLRTWLLNGTAVNMAYMLSVQMTAMQLNVRHGFVSAGALIYAPGTTSANAVGFASIQSILDEANASLQANPNTVASGDIRAYQEVLKNALDAANNNKNFVQATPCTYTFAE